MGNKERGEIDLKAGGKTYTLRLSIDAICQLEEITGRGIGDILEELSQPAKMRVKTTRAILWAALNEHHPDITLLEAGDLIVEAGGVINVLGVISQAVKLAFPNPDGEAANGAAARPMKATKAAAAGIGRAS